MTPDTNATLNHERRSRAESARINGARSRGPKTSAGKARSSRNALRHGLLSKRIMPLLSTNGERVDYEHHLRGLMREFAPQTTTELNIVETMARDWIRHARIGQFTDNLLQPFSEKGFEKPPQVLNEVLFQHRCLEDAIENLARDGRFGLSDEQQVVIRKAIMKFISGLPPMKAAAMQKVAVLPLQLDRPQAYAASALRLTDTEYLINTLGDKVELASSVSEQWTRVLTAVLGDSIAHMGETALQDHEHERACRRTICYQQEDLPYLERLMELEAKGRRAMRENIELLMGLRRQRATTGVPAVQ